MSYNWFIVLGCRIFPAFSIEFADTADGGGRTDCRFYVFTKGIYVE